MGLLGYIQGEIRKQLQFILIMPITNDVRISNPAIPKEKYILYTRIIKTLLETKQYYQFGKQNLHIWIALINCDAKQNLDVSVLTSYTARLFYGTSKCLS